MREREREREKQEIQLSGERVRGSFFRGHSYSASSSSSMAPLKPPRHKARSKSSKQKQKQKQQRCGQPQYYEWDYHGILYCWNNTTHLLIIIVFGLLTFLICSMGWQHQKLLRNYALLQPHEQHSQSQLGLMDPSFTSTRDGFSTFTSSLSDRRAAKQEQLDKQHYQSSSSGYMRGTTTSGIGDGTDYTVPVPVQQPQGETAEGPESNNKGNWAYALLMAGIDPDEPQGNWYHGILFNAMIVAENLHRETRNSRHPVSTADVLLMVQFAVTAETTKLPDEEEGWLHAAGVKIIYLPLPDHGVQNFYTIQLEKFRILQYTQYSRVLFMDGDVMPYCSLDYLFELSEAGQLQENMVIAWRTEPSSGGFFMFTPHAQDYAEITQIIDQHERKALETGIIFDPVEGWGHKITPPDKFRTNIGSSSSTWHWHGDFVDQGLLYYWVKYYKKNVSIIAGSITEHWVNDPETEYGVKTRSWTSNNEPFTSTENCPCRIGGNDNNLKHAATTQHIFTKIAPFRDFIHFTGMGKPWLASNQGKMDILDIVQRVEGGDSGYDPNQFRHPGGTWYSNMFCSVLFCVVVFYKTIIQLTVVRVSS